MFRFRPYRHGRTPLPGGLRTYWTALADAQKEVPHGSEPSEWVQGLYRACCSWSEELAANWCRADRALFTRWLSLQTALQHAGMEMEKARREEAQREAERPPEPSDEQNPLAHSLSTAGYMAAMALLTFLELPLIYLSFTALGLSPAFTLMLSMLSACLTAFLGHVVGTVSRHLRLGARPMLVALLFLSLCFAGSLAWLREEAMVVIQSDGATLNPTAAAVALFAISLASLVGASLLAWHHGGDPADRALHRARQHRRRRERAVERLRYKLSRAELTRRATRDMARQDVLALGQAMLGTFHRYARWNQLHRDKHDLPPCLHDGQLPRLPLPALLEQPLSWAPQELTL